MSRRYILSLATAALTISLASLLASRSVAAGGGGCHEPATDGRGARVDLKQNCFITTVLRIDRGDTVTFTNRDALDHTVSGAGRSWGSYEPLPAGGSVTHAFDANGVYPYFCAFHPGMVGAIVVGDGSGPDAARGDGSAPAGVVLTGAGRDGARAATAIGDATASSRSGRGVIALAAAAGAAAAVLGGGVFMLARSRRRSAALVTSGMFQREPDAG